MFRSLVTKIIKVQEKKGGKMCSWKIPQIAKDPQISLDGPDLDHL